MDLTLIALKQTAVMFLLMAIGWLLFKGSKITKEGSRDLANMLLYVILPCAIVNAFCTEYTEEKSLHLLYAFGLGLAALVLAILISRLIFRKRPIDHFGAAFSNAGFMGLPMIQAVLGTGAVIYSAPFIALLGVYLAQTDLKSLFADKMLYLNSAVRLLAIPLVTLALFCLLPASLQEARMALLIVASAPVGSNVAVYAQLNHLDYTYASKSVCLSTLFSILTMPLMIALAGLLWR